MWATYLGSSKQEVYSAGLEDDWQVTDNHSPGRTPWLNNWQEQWIMESVVVDGWAMLTDDGLSLELPSSGSHNSPFVLIMCLETSINSILFNSYGF